MTPPKSNASAVVGTIIGIVALIGIGGGSAMLFLGKHGGSPMVAPCTGNSCQSPTPQESSSDITWSLQWFDSQHHVGVTGSDVLDEKTGAQANLSLTCWGGASPSLKVGIAYANFDIKTERHLHREAGQFNLFGPNGPDTVYTTESESLDVATMLDSQYNSYTVKPDTVNSFELDNEMYTTQQLRAANQFKVIFGANGKRQVVAVDLKNETFAKFLSECDTAYQAAQKAAADAAAQQAADDARRAAAAAVHLRTYNKSADFEAPMTINNEGITYWSDPNAATDSNSQYDTNAGTGTLLRIQQVNQDGYGVDSFYNTIWSSGGTVHSGWVKAEDFDRYIGQERSGDVDAPSPPADQSQQNASSGEQ
jgi:hypothetical protein